MDGKTVAGGKKMENKQTNPSSGRKLVEDALYTTGRVVAKAGKIGQTMSLDTVAAASQKAWQETKISSVRFSEEIKEGTVDLAKSFQAGLQSLTSEAGDDPLPATMETGRVPTKSDLQLEGLYNHFGKIIYENSQKGDLSYLFHPEFGDLQRKADQILAGIDMAVEVTAARAGLLFTEPALPDGRQSLLRDAEGAGFDPAEVPRFDAAGEKSFEQGFIEAAARKLQDNKTSRNEKVGILKTLVSNIPGSVCDFINTYFENADIKAKRSFLGLLASINEPFILPIYQRLLDSDNPLLRQNGIIGLNRLNHPQAKAVILSSVSDPAGYIRRLAANCLSHEGSEAEMFALVKLINDPDDGVSRVAIRKLGKSRSRFAFTHLIAKLDSESEKIRKEVVGALQSITGTDPGSAHEPSVKSLSEAVRCWQQVWKDNQTNHRFLKDPKATNAVIKKYFEKATVTVKRPVVKVSVSKKAAAQAPAEDLPGAVPVAKNSVVKAVPPEKPAPQAPVEGIPETKAAKKKPALKPPAVQKAASQTPAEGLPAAVTATPVKDTVK